MKQVSLVIISLLSILATPAVGCSFGGVDLFKPSLKRFDAHPGPAQKNPPEKGDYWEKIPDPIVSVLKITRGTAKASSSCDDAGTILLSIKLPPVSTYHIGEFGVYFRLLEGKLPDEIFPDVPLIGKIEGDEMKILLAWLDNQPKKIALNFRLEVFLVANGLDIGPSTTVEIKD